MVSFFGSVLYLAGTGLATEASNAGLFIARHLMLLGIGGIIVAAIGPVWMAELRGSFWIEMRS